MEIDAKCYPVSKTKKTKEKYSDNWDKILKEVDDSDLYYKKAERKYRR